MRYSKILIKLTLKRGLTGNVAKVTCTCLEVPLEKPPPIALRASRAATANPRQTFHRAVWLFTRIRFNRIRLIRRRVLEIPSRSWRSRLLRRQPSLRVAQPVAAVCRTTKIGWFEQIGRGSNLHVVDLGPRDARRDRERGGRRGGREERPWCGSWVGSEERVTDQEGRKGTFN